MNNTQTQNKATEKASTACNCYVAPPENAEELNHLAYDDVLDGNAPTWSLIILCIIGLLWKKKLNQQIGGYDERTKN